MLIYDLVITTVYAFQVVLVEFRLIRRSSYFERKSTSTDWERQLERREIFEFLKWCLCCMLLSRLLFGVTHWTWHNISTSSHHFLDFEHFWPLPEELPERQRYQRNALTVQEIRKRISVWAMSLDFLK